MAIMHIIVHANAQINLLTPHNETFTDNPIIF